jgi:hypothetical protein
MFRSFFLPSRQIRVKVFSDLKIAFFKITHCKKIRVRLMIFYSGSPRHIGTLISQACTKGIM